jgi:hypothetical protein
MVVRIHPREDVNRRDKVSSGHLLILRERFSRPFQHVRFVWPAEPVSSYDLMELADVGLSAWSSTAVEMARLGVPVVVAFDRHTPFPIGDVVTWSPDRDGYFRCVDEALRSQASLDRIRFSYRWSNLALLGSSVDMGDVIPDSGFHGLPLPAYKTPAAAKLVEDILVHDHDSLAINRAALVAKQGDDEISHELSQLKRQLRRCIWFLCTGVDRSADYRLFYSSSDSPCLPPGYDAMLHDDGRLVEFRTKDRAIRRRSQMARRLAVLAAQNNRMQ